MTLRSVRSAYLLAAAVVLLDQMTKVLAVEALEDGPISLFGDFLELSLTRNPGAAFSSFTGGGRVLAFIAIAIAIGIAATIPRVERGVERTSLALVLGGALGNLIDRVVRGDGIFDGAVVDFIDFSFWPTFNVADSAITIGVVLLLVASANVPRRGLRSPTGPASPPR